MRHAAASLRQHFGDPPATALVLGSGLGVVVDRMRIEAQADYPALGLPGSAVVGHAGRAVVGSLGGQRVVAFSGRVHRYEGHPIQQIVRYVRALQRWGVKRLLLTCACGGIREDLVPGSLVLLSDHLNFMADSPLIGPAFAERFPDTTYAYDPAMRAHLRSVAERLGIALPEGVYAAMMGPAYETPAEIRMVQILGADVVGMSTVPEILAAAEVGLTAAAVGMVSNRAAGLAGVALSHADVTEVAGEAGATLAHLLEEALAAF